MAFFAPLLVLLLVIAVDLGQALSVRHLLETIARETVRQLSIQPGLENGTHQNLQSGCGAGLCAENHAQVHKKAFLLIDEAMKKGLYIYPDPEAGDPDYPNLSRLIETSYDPAAKIVTAEFKVFFRGSFKVYFISLDRYSIRTRKSGPYLASDS